MSSKSTTPTNSPSSSVLPRHHARLMSQTPLDARLASAFDESKQHFDYSSSVDLSLSTTTSNVSPSTVSSYLQKIQRGSLTQSFGCLIAIDETNFQIIAYSENALEILDLAAHAVPNIEQLDALTFGIDVRTLFTSSGATALQKAVNFPDISILNPILLNCKTSGKPFYAVLHRIDVGLVIDLEPVNLADAPVTAAGALKSYKLAAKAISKLQSIPSRNISLLCDTLVKEVSELTGYDRVMVYKFHEDEHGEVISEHCRADLEPYFGLHYPATDIPQASRFLFLKNKVRMICDCLSPPVKVIQDKKLAQPLSLGGSTLRAPHGCHAQYMANMGSIASLVLAVTINEGDDEAKGDQPARKLWGLVVCHHTTTRLVPFPLRYACEFLIQVFAIHISKEVELAIQMREKHNLRIQTVLCDMLMRNSVMSVITQSPNLMDLVQCDGAAVYYNYKVWVLGIAPSEEQIKDISRWLIDYHGGTNGLCTDSLLEAGYPRASELADAVCGMAAVRFNSKDFLFWFRSHTAKELKWGGAKHDPGDSDGKGKMHPRSSFKAFLEVVKWRSVPWEDMEMDAIHSLQLILKDSFPDSTMSSKMVDTGKMIVNVPGPGDPVQSMDELQAVTGEMVRLIETAAVPIFSVDASGKINGWNDKVAELTGLPIGQAIGLHLFDVIADGTNDAMKKMLSLGLQGVEEKGVEVRLKRFGAQANSNPVISVVNACCSRDIEENVTGICFIGQDITSQRLILDKYTQLQGDYSGIMRNPSPLIPPIFMMDERGMCLEWNGVMEKLSGLNKEEAIGRTVFGEVFTVDSVGCQVKDCDTLIKLRILVNKILAGEEADNLLFGFFDCHNNCVNALLSATPRATDEGKITGVLCFLHVPSPELHHAMQMQMLSEKAAANSLNKLMYLREQMKKPVSGLVFTRKLIGSSDLSKEQKSIVVTRSLCEDQLMKVIEDTDVSSIEAGYAEVNTVEFNLGEALDAVMSQVMSLSQENQVPLVRDSPSEVSSMFLYGDTLRLQQVLAEFLSIAVQFTPMFKLSSVILVVNPRREYLGSKMQMLHVEFRITHPSPGVPEKLIYEMFHHSPGMSREGLGLYISHRLVKIMNGNVQYLRGEESSSFIVHLEFPLVRDSGSSSVQYFGKVA